MARSDSLPRPDSLARRASRQLLQRLGLVGAARFVRGVGAGELVRHVRSRRSQPRTALPLPGPARMFSVAGTADVDWFLSSGRAGADSIVETLAGVGVEFSSLRSVLDFGCGCGRVLRHLCARESAANKGTRTGGPPLYGCDLNPRSVRWCQRHLPESRFRVNALEPPLPYGDHHFDLVYAFSVFTHMPLDLQRRWLAELHRVVEPEGFVLLTTHGASYLSHLTADEQTRFRAGEPVVRYDDAAGSNLCGAYHPASAFAALARGFEVVLHQPEGAKGNPHQDLFLLRRAAGPPIEVSDAD